MTVSMPREIARLPKDKHGRPIPWFVYIDDNGIPDFRVIRHGGPLEAAANRICWICGEKRGREGTFVSGPMCVVNRNSAEPPSHWQCATYAARVCPFLTRPNMVRRETGLPEGYRSPGGVAIARNPGVAAVYRSRDWEMYRVPNGFLFDMGEPLAVTWWAEGRSATPDEIRESIRTGVPLLEEQAKAPRDKALLRWQVRRAEGLIPA